MIDLFDSNNLNEYLEWFFREYLRRIKSWMEFGILQRDTYCPKYYYLCENFDAFFLLSNETNGWIIEMANC